MNLNPLKWLRNVLRRRKNKPGGMAWIRGLTGDLEVLNNRAVRTVRLRGGDVWVIEPPQPFTAKHGVRSTITGTYVPPNCDGRVDGIVDSCLVPWKDDGVTPAEVAKLYRPTKTIKVFEVHW